MAKKHKHEEHVNHERWLVSFADMMTLLFALFVVLYAMSAVDLEKLDKLKKSIQFAFHIEGDGGTQTEGHYVKGGGDGDLLDAFPLVSAQQEGMIEFLRDELLDDWQEDGGRSPDIVQNDDSIAIHAPLDNYFVPGEVATLKVGVYDWLADLTRKSLEWASGVRVRIEYDYVPARSIPRPGGGKPRVVMSDEIVAQRLVMLRRMFTQMPKVQPHEVLCENQELEEGRKRRSGGWENRARLVLIYSTN